MRGIRNVALGRCRKGCSDWWLLALVVLPTLVWADTKDDALPVLDTPPPGIVSYGDHAMPSYFDPVLLALGSDLHADLSNMQDAVQSRDLTALRIQLHQARNDLDTMRLPDQRTALTRQERMMSSDLGKRTASLAKDLWLPLQVEVAETLTGSQSDGTSDVDGATVAQSGPLNGELHYAVTVFPLNRMSTLLDQIKQAASTDSPDWQSLSPRSGLLTASGAKTRSGPTAGSICSQ